MFTGQQIRRARKRLGLTQVELADAISVSPPYVSLLESGKRHPSPEVQKALLRTLRLDELGAAAAMREVRLGDLPPASNRVLLAAYAATSALGGAAAAGSGAASRLEQLLIAFAHLERNDQETVLALANHLKSKTPSAAD